MSLDLYSPTIKDRVNPEFVGIAKKHSASKKKRQQIENQRDRYLQALKYKISVDLSLEKKLEEQKEKLQNVRSTHQRKMAEEKFKHECQETRRHKLRSLSSSVREQREENKRNIRTALLHVFNRNRRSQQQGKMYHEALASKLKEQEHSLSLDNRKKFREVKLGQKFGKDTVNKFYRTLNKESLNSYQSWITEENEKTNEYSTQIQVMETTIGKLDRQIQKKKDKILSVFSEIEGYTSQSAVEQSKCLPPYLRPSLSSHSSRPRDILLKGPKEVVEKKMISSII